MWIIADSNDEWIQLTNPNEDSFKSLSIQGWKSHSINT